MRRQYIFYRRRGAGNLSWSHSPHFPAGPPPPPNYRLTPLGIVLPGAEVDVPPVGWDVEGRAPRFGIVVGGMVEVMVRPAWFAEGFLVWASFCLYCRSSRTRMSNSSRSVSIVLCVSYLSYSLFSIWVFSNFLSFLLSSSSCLHLSAFLRIFSRLLERTPTYWLWLPWIWGVYWLPWWPV